MEKFIAAGKLPNFERFRDGVRRCSRPRPTRRRPNLEPWIQWVTVHSGHPVRASTRSTTSATGTSSRRRTSGTCSPTHGKSVWVCGSMNINYQSPINGWVLPDPWVTQGRARPRRGLEPYYKFVSANVQEHTSEQRRR